MRYQTLLALSVCLPFGLLASGNEAMAIPKVVKANNFENLLQRGQNLLSDVREIKCFKDKAEDRHWYELLHAYRDAITDLQNTTYPYHKHEPLDSHIERLDTIANKIFNNLINLDICSPPQPNQSVTPPPAPTPPSPPAPKAEVAPEHSSAGGPSLGGELAGAYANDWTILANYQHFDPKTGENGHQWGVGGAGLIQIGQGIAVNFSGGYNGISGDHSTVDNWYGNGAVVWETSDLRFGPTVGYQSNSEDSFHADTWNYGGFVDYYHSSNITFGAKAGGFSTSGTGPDSDGYYLGGSVTGYWNPNLSTTGSIDYTHFSPRGGSNETDYGIRVGWRPCPTTPVSLWGGYTYSTFGPGSFTVNTISAGVMIDLGNGQTLIDSDRGGTVITQTGFVPLDLRF